MHRISQSLGISLTSSMGSLLHRAYESFQYLATEGWKPYSRLILDSDNAGWVLDWEMREISKIAQRLGIRTASPRWRNIWIPLSIFITNQFFLLNEDWLRMRHRIAFSYFHGLPGTSEESFDQVYMSLRKYHTRIARIQVSHTQMRNVVLETGIDPSKVFQIPIAVNLDFFPLRESASKNHAREKLGIPQSAFVIGSFQKDGVGWGAGNEPKLIKGPDIFLKTIKKLKAQIPELYVLISGPARGYVRAGLEALQVPYQHSYLDDYSVIGRMYQALDLYLVTSRQEGGPKAVLESMASGIPLISTRVGQAMDLVQHEKNGWLAEVDDVEALAQCALKVYSLDEKTLASVLAQGRMTAEANSYDAQVPLWAEFMKGFVTCNFC